MHEYHQMTAFVFYRILIAYLYKWFDKNFIKCEIITGIYNNEAKIKVWKNFIKDILLPN